MEKRKIQVFICGSRSLRELSAETITLLRQCVWKGSDILVGDAPGADALVQNWFAEHNYAQVTVYHVGKSPRTNRGFPTVKVFGPQERKDDYMIAACDLALLLWDGTSSGTARNLDQLTAQGIRSRIVEYGTPLRIEPQRQICEWDERIRQSGHDLAPRKDHTALTVDDDPPQRSHP